MSTERHETACWMCGSGAHRRSSSWVRSQRVIMAYRRSRYSKLRTSYRTGLPPRIWGSSILVTWASLAAQTVKNLPAVQETWVGSLAQEYPLEKEMATHSSILPWRRQRRLVGYNPCGHKEADMTEQPTLSWWQPMTVWGGRPHSWAARDWGQREGLQGGVPQTYCHTLSPTPSTLSLALFRRAHYIPTLSLTSSLQGCGMLAWITTQPLTKSL